MLRDLIPVIVVLTLAVLAFTAVQWGLAMVYTRVANQFEQVQHVK